MRRDRIRDKILSHPFYVVYAIQDKRNIKNESFMHIYRYILY